MALPRNNFNTYELVLPSTGKKIKYRPWLVGEQKHLLMSLAGSDDEILLAVRNAVDTCTFGELDVNRMANFDLEYIFLKIRTKSAGEGVDLILTCQHCEGNSEYRLNLNDVEVQKVEGHSPKIMLSPNLGVEMAYPTAEQLTLLNKDYSVENVYKTICECIRTVFTDEEVHDTKDETEEEIRGFIESLTQDQFNLIERFFTTMPSLKHSFVSKCPHCEQDTRYTLEGIEAFFG